MATEPIQASRVADPDPDLTSTDTREHLEALITVNRDASDGFETAAGAIEDPETTSRFMRFASERRRFVSELLEAAEPFGGASTGGSITAALHRSWIAIKDAVTTDDEAILEAVRTGEEHAADAYEAALGSDLPPQLDAVVTRQFDRVQEVRAQLDDLPTRADAS